MSLLKNQATNECSYTADANHDILEKYKDSNKNIDDDSFDDRIALCFLFVKRIVKEKERQSLLKVTNFCEEETQRFCDHCNSHVKKEISWGRQEKKDPKYYVLLMISWAPKHSTK